MITKRLSTTNISLTVFEIIKQNVYFTPCHNAKAHEPVLTTFSNGGSLTNFISNESARMLTLCVNIETCDLHTPQVSTSFTADRHVHSQDNSTTDITDVCYNICVQDY